MWWTDRDGGWRRAKAGPLQDLPPLPRALSAQNSSGPAPAARAGGCGAMLAALAAGSGAVGLPARWRLGDACGRKSRRRRSARRREAGPFSIWSAGCAMTCFSPSFLPHRNEIGMQSANDLPPSHLNVSDELRVCALPAKRWR